MTKKQYAQAERDLRILARSWSIEAAWCRTRAGRKYIGGSAEAERIAMLYESAAEEMLFILNNPEEP